VNKPDHPPEPSLIYSPSYPTSSTLEKLQKRRRRNLLIIAVVLLFLFGVTFLEVQYIELPSLAVVGLFNLNLLLLILLVVLIFRNSIKLFMERGQVHVGSKFRTKLVVAFIVLSMLPTGLLALIGSNLIVDSIQNWFNPQINEFVEDAMEVARFSHASFEELIDHFAQTLSRLITTEYLMEPGNRNDLEKLLQKKQIEYNLELIQIFDREYREVWRGKINQLPSGVLLTSDSQPVIELLKGNSYFRTSFLGSGEIIQHGIPIYSMDSPEIVQGALIISLFLPKGVTQKIRHPVERPY